VFGKSCDWMLSVECRFSFRRSFSILYLAVLMAGKEREGEEGRPRRKETMERKAAGRSAEWRIETHADR
jgi:hypothetical protein